MRTETDEFSFIVKPSTIPGAGVGVFATHDIKEGTKLRLFGEEGAGDDRVRKKSDVPEEFLSLCVLNGNEVVTGSDFGHLYIGWYMNHSKQPNAVHRGDHYCAVRDIVAGEEILIDYNALGEPEESKEAFYKI
jgi:SET domain-containing protein